MKTFKVTVDNQTYTVKVEEIAGNTNQEPENTAETSGTQVVAESPKPAPEKAAPAAEQKQEEAPKAAPASGDGYTLKAPMPGSVLEVKVSEGDSVKDGDVLLVLEAMKMENELTASQPGTVSQVLVKKGESVNSGDPLVVIA